MKQPQYGAMNDISNLKLHIEGQKCIAEYKSNVN